MIMWFTQTVTADRYTWIFFVQNIVCIKNDFLKTVFQLAPYIYIRLFTSGLSAMFYHIKKAFKARLYQG